ncbi:MADF domain [Cinara cedri]|uniref:MADF domain n=1 Tax=Cinara cedri TaxID=506608 RepID=A0A5E4NA83_9HEMI|nr:MADF domain [Cinara cedri]
MDDEMLIEEIRQYQELYDMMHKKYSDNIHKDNIWRKLDSELKTTGPTCKNRWISLHDQLRKAITINITKSGKAAEPKKKWKYEESMSFVIPFFKERETHANIAEPDSLSDEL